MKYLLLLIMIPFLFPILFIWKRFFEEITYKDNKDWEAIIGIGCVGMFLTGLYLMLWILWLSII